MTVRHRDGFEVPEPLVPGEVVVLRFRLLDVLHTFGRGHRVQVQVQPSLFPILARQPHAWAANPMLASPEDYVEASLRVHRSGDHPSRLRVGVAADGGER
jgi:hypothetical protein